MASKSISAESGLQMLSRLSGNSTSNVGDLQPALFPPGLLQPHQVVEVWGPESMAVSRLCTHLLSRCLLPTSVRGLAADAIFIDTEHHMQIQQLVASLESAMRKGGISRKETSKGLKTALNQLLILPCHNSTELLSSIISLPQLIRSRRNKVALVVINSPAAYYLPELLTDTNQGQNMPSKDQYLAEMLAPLLNSEINQLNIVLVFTLPVNYQKSFVASHLQNRGHSVHIKEASDAPDGELKVLPEPGSCIDSSKFQVTLCQGKDFVLQTLVTFSESEEFWTKLV